MADEQEQRITLTRQELRQLQEDITRTATTEALKVAHLAGAMALEGLAEAIEKAPLEASSEPARQGAEQAIRAIARVARETSSLMRTNARQNMP